MVCSDFNYLKLQKNLNIEKNITFLEKIKDNFKVVEIKFLAMHIINTKFSFDIFAVGNLLNIFIEHDLYLMS